MASESSAALPQPPEREDKNWDERRRTAVEAWKLGRKTMKPKPRRPVPPTHSAVIGSGEARQAGLPVRELEADDPWWQEIWHLWTRYYALGPTHLLSAYEGAKASQVRVLRAVSNHDHTG